MRTDSGTPPPPCNVSEIALMRVCLYQFYEHENDSKSLLNLHDHMYVHFYGAVCSSVLKCVWDGRGRVRARTRTAKVHTAKVRHGSGCPRQQALCTAGCL